MTAAEEDGYDLIIGLIDAAGLGSTDWRPEAPSAKDRGASHLEAWEKVRQCAKLLQNDTDNGRRLIIWFGDRIRFIRDIGWASWTGTHWEIVGGIEQVKMLAQKVSTYIACERHCLRPGKAEYAILTGDDHKAKAAVVSALKKRRAARRAFAVSSGNEARIGNLIRAAEPHMTIGVEMLDRDPMAFNVQNGTLIFSRAPDPDCPDPDVVRLVGSVKLIPHDPAMLISKLAPVIYDEQASWPFWDRFINRFQPVEAKRSFLQTFHGYGLLGLMGAQKLVYNYGEGANGKSTFIEAICRLMGSYARTLNAESVTGTQQRNAGQATPDLAQLPGARLVRVSELPRGEKLKETLVKSLTGGEPIMARHNYGNYFEFRPNFKPSMSGNDMPSIDGVDHGIWRRIAIVNWTVTLTPDEMRDMEEVLAEFSQENAGILNWLIAGALRYLSEGLTVPVEVQKATSDLKADSDPVQLFIDACVTRTDSPSNTETARNLYLGYESWCIANARKPWSEKLFATVMGKKGFNKIEARVRVYTNVILHDVPERPANSHDPPRSPSGFV